MFKEPSFLKKANLFQPILVVVISIIGGTPMEGANTGKIVLLIILGAAFIVWHVECQRLLNRNRETREHACALKNRSAALYKKTYAALSGEYENFANKLNGESCQEAKTDGSRWTTESFNGACLFLCSTIAAALAEYKNSLVFALRFLFRLPLCGPADRFRDCLFFNRGRTCAFRSYHFYRHHALDQSDISSSNTAYSSSTSLPDRLFLFEFQFFFISAYFSSIGMLLLAMIFIFLSHSKSDLHSVQPPGF